MGTAPEEYYWDIANATKIGQYLTKKEAKFIDSVLEGNPYNKSCLDIGAGSGRFAIPLYEKGFAVVALEYDLIPLRKLCEKNKNIPTIHANAHHLPFKDSTFDCILLIEVEAGLAMSYVMSECYRVLKCDGILLTTRANKNSYKPLMRLLIRKENKWGSYQLTYKDHIKEIRKQGFTIQKVWGFNWLPAVRNSNSKLIPLYSFIETFLKLEPVPSISPWLFIVAKKSSNNKNFGEPS